MSATTDLLEKTASTLDLATDHQEFWAGTLHEKVIQAAIDQVESDLKSNDYERLYWTSLPALNVKLIDSAKEMAALSQEAFIAGDVA
jgi:hypothetical protein